MQEYEYNELEEILNQQDSRVEEELGNTFWAIKQELEDD